MRLAASGHCAIWFSSGTTFEWRKKRFDLFGRWIAEIAFAGDAHAVGQAAGEGFADDLFGLAVTVARRQIDQVDPGSHRRMYRGDAFVECRFAPDHADAAAAQRQRRDRRKLTKTVLPHECRLSGYGPQFVARLTPDAIRGKSDIIGKASPGLLLSGALARCQARDERWYLAELLHITTQPRGPRFAHDSPVEEGGFELSVPLPSQ